MSTQKACNSSINPKSWKLSGQSKCQPKKLAAVDLKSVHSKMSTQKACSCRSKKRKTQMSTQKDCSCQPKKYTFQNVNPKSLRLLIWKSYNPNGNPKILQLSTQKEYIPKCQPKKLTAGDLCKKRTTQMSTQKACSGQPKKSTFQNVNPKSLQLSTQKEYIPKFQPKKHTAVDLCKKRTTQMSTQKAYSCQLNPYLYFILFKYGRKVMKKENHVTL